MTILIEARKLADYIAGLDNFKMYHSAERSVYNHITALYTDIVLQAGLNYNNVVLPRVRQVLTKYPEAHNLNGLSALLYNVSMEELIQWKHKTKIDRMHRLIEFSKNNNINTETDLKKYLLIDSNKELFLNIDGIGPKTLDYTLKLLNFDTVAVDRHIVSFIELAGIEKKDYFGTKSVVEYAADLLNMSRSTMDASIWKYMSRKDFQSSTEITGQLAIGFT